MLESHAPNVQSSEFSSAAERFNMESTRHPASAIQEAIVDIAKEQKGGTKNVNLGPAWPSYSKSKTASSSVLWVCLKIG